MHYALNIPDAVSDRSPLDDLFPEVRRVVYGKAAVSLAICQLKFPAILRIESELPAQFQDLVRTEFPIFERQINPFAAQMPTELQSLIGAAMTSVGYTFKSPDGSATLSLTNESIGLTTSGYTRWEDFWAQLSGPISAFVQLYAPAFFSRIGLRYQNLIAPDVLGLTGVPWSELLRAELLGEISDEQWRKYATEARRLLRLRSPDANEGILIQHGFGPAAIGPPPSTYMIDVDIYTDERTGTQDAQSILERFRRRATRAFRWCLLGRLHDAMEPTNIDPDDK